LSESSCIRQLWPWHEPAWRRYSRLSHDEAQTGRRIAALVVMSTGQRAGGALQLVHAIHYVSAAGVHSTCWSKWAQRTRPIVYLNLLQACGHVLQSIEPAAGDVQTLLKRRRS
jgi:hypothetical protein